MNNNNYEYEERKIAKESADESNKENRWWHIEDTLFKSSTIFEIVNLITANQASFWRTSLIYAQLYENIDSIVGSLSTSFLNRNLNLGFNPGSRAFSSKLTYNVCKSCVDSALAKIGKNKPRIKFVTSGADHKLQVKAKNLTKCIDGLFYNTEAYKYGMLAFKDACIFGTGCVKIYADPISNEIKIDRIIVPSEIIVDYQDAKYGFPKQMHQLKTVNKDVLLATYPEHAVAITQAQTVVNPYTTTMIGDSVIVIESWHLPSTPKSKDGNHCISINNEVLFNEDYDKNYFPFVFYKWTSRVEGFWGMGLCEELSAIQLSINKLHKMINAGMEINCVPRVYVEAGSMLNKNSYYDGGIGEYKPGSAAPIAITTPGQPSDVYAYLETMYQKAYQITGISLMGATAQKPQGIDSAVAQREYNDLNDARFAIQGDQFEQVYMKIAKIMIDIMRDLYKSDKHVSINAKTDNNQFIESIKWKDADLEDDYMRMQCFPVSRLPTTPEGRLATVTNLMQAGIISKPQGVELLDMPDIENFYSLFNASYDATMADLDAIVEEDESRTPEPYLDLSMAKQLAQAYYLRARESSLDEDILQKIRDYISNIDELVKAAQPPPPPPVPPLNQAVSAPPPQSELMPQNPKGKQ